MPAPNPSTLLLLKLTLAPSLVGIASVIMARLGPRVGGMVTALPVVSGPLLLLFALEQGPMFASIAAAKALIGTVALVSYAVTYAQLAPLRKRRHWPWLCLLLGWLVFIGTAAILERVTWPKPVGIALALCALYLGVLGLSRLQDPHQNRLTTAPTPWLLGVRMGAAALLVWFVATAAARLGPTWSGLLTAFPVVGSVMLVATHIDHGLPMALAWLRAFLLGLTGYVGFLTGVTYSMVPLGIAWSFCIGLATAAAIQALVTWRFRSHGAQTDFPPLLQTPSITLRQAASQRSSSM